MTSQGQVRQDVKEGSQLPVRRDLAEEFGFGDRALQDAVNATTRVVARPSIPQYAEISTIISCGVSDIIQDSATRSASGFKTSNATCRTCWTEVRPT
jgi:hypothetical protein